MRWLTRGAILFCFVLVVGSVLLSLTPSTADATTESNSKATFEGAEKLQLDTKVAVTLTNEITKKFYTFTPTVSGVYKVESIGEVDSIVTIYNDYYTRIGSDDNSGTNKNFGYAIYLVAGRTYLYEMDLWGNNSGTYNVWITRTTSMEVTAPPNRTYFEGTTDCYFLGLSATLSYSDGTKATYDNRFISNAYSCLPFELHYEPIHAGNNTITLVYGDFSGSFTVTGEPILSHVASATPIALNTDVATSATYSGADSYYSYVPSVSGLYNFNYNSYSSVDTYIFNANGTQIKRLAYDDSSSYMCYLEAGKTYYFATISNIAQDYHVTLTKVKDIADIQILNFPTKQVYTVECERFDIAGLEIMISYKDGSNDIVQMDHLQYYEVDKSPVEIYYGAITQGNNPITITYRGYSMTFYVTGITIPEMFANAKVISGNPDTTFYLSSEITEIVNKFVPTVSGTYTFITTAKDAIEVNVYNAYGERIGNYGNYGFSIEDGKYVYKYSRYLEKGNDYYLMTMNPYNHNNYANSFTIRMTTKTSYTVPKGVTATYGQKLGQVALPPGFSWEGSTDTVLNSIGNHVFIAKYTPAGGNNSSVVSGIEIPVNVQPPVYTITYTLNGGSNSPSNSATYGLLTSNLTLRSPTRIGYLFAGWYTDSTFKNKVTAIAKTSQANICLYAKWTKITVKRGSISGLTGTKPGKILISYKKISKVKGYQIVCATNRKFKKAKSYTTKKLTFTLSKRKKGTTYYVKIRGYKMDSAGKRVYGKYSKVRKIKVV